MQFDRNALATSLLAAACVFTLAGAASAQDKAAAACVVTTTRNACPGQEAESYKKCEGKQSCSKPVEAASAEACAAAATTACSNDRLEITKSKTITVTYDGKPLKSKSGKADMCLDYPKRAAEFDKCPAKK
jgi:hypothetical protein